MNAMTRLPMAVLAVSVLLGLGSPVARAAPAQPPAPSPSPAPSRTSQTPQTPQSRPVPFEEQRFARVAAGLARDPLFVDMELADAVPVAARRAIKASMARTSQALGVPVYVIAIPNERDSESYGSDGTFLNAMRKHVGRDGLYLLIDGDARLEGAAYGVPRDFFSLGLPFHLSGSGENPEERFARLPERVDRALESFADAPSGPPATSEPDVGVPPFGQENPPLHAEFWGPFINGLLFLGPIAALILFGLVMLPFRPWRTEARPTAGSTKQKKQSKAPPTPTAGWLRHTADQELRSLAKRMDPDQLMVKRVHDAARKLYDETRHDDAATDADAFLDMVGVIVLARYGKLARQQGKPGPPCFVNPLHGQAVRTRKISHVGRRPVCSACGTGQLRLRTLRVPDGRAHYEVPGRWRDNGFGTLHPTTHPYGILRSLGAEPATVDSAQEAD
jgi:hypothetical protein